MSDLEKTVSRRKSKARSQKRRRPAAVLVIGVLGSVIALALGGLFLYEWSYYTSPLAERIFHPHHSWLRSSGRLGLLFGISGTFLMLLNLAYLVRKRFARVRWVGSLRVWVGLHVTTGLVAGALILMHSAMTLRSASGLLAFLALSITILTGVIGRYIYSFVPRSVEGHELEFDEVRKRLQSSKARLIELGVSSKLLEIDSRPITEGYNKGFFRSAAAFIAGDRESRQEYWRLCQSVLSSRRLRASAGMVLPLARDLCREWQWLVRYRELRSLMSSWRFLHRWLAIVMVIVATLHIAVALIYGDLWILGGSP